MKAARLISTGLVAACLAIAPSASTAAPPNDSVVQVESGQIQGAVVGNVLSFKGIPFAAPPVGNLRWRPPQPVSPWAGIRSATRFGHDCMQVPASPHAPPSRTPPAEDCLVLNVWRPIHTEPGVKLPVVVWIHGGAFVNGGSSTPMANGSEIAQQGVVFVSFNYRLGRFGFFAHPALRAEGGGRIANYAFMDQLAALQWVQRNIAALGGNPSQVTVMGESAGGISVMHLLTWQAAHNLFQRAIVLSGGGRNYLLPVRKLRGFTRAQPSAEESGILFARSQGIRDTGAAGLAALRALPATRVAGDLNLTTLLQRSPTYTGGPILDGQIVTTTPGPILQRGEAAQVPILVGSMAQDLPAILPPLHDPLSYFGTETAHAQAVYNPDSQVKPLELALQIGADITMHEPARFVAQQMTAAGQPAWLYRFGYGAQTWHPKVTGAAQASELPMLFDTLAGRYGLAVPPRDQAAGQLFHSYLVNFIKTGNPNGHSLPLWPRFNLVRSQLMLFTPNQGAVVQPDPWKERLDLVERATNSSAAASSSSP